MTLEEILGELASRGMPVTIDTKHVECGSDRTALHVELEKVMKKTKGKGKGRKC